MENLIFVAMQTAGQVAPDQFELFMIREDIYGFPLKILLVGLALIIFFYFPKGRTIKEIKRTAVACTVFAIFWTILFLDVWRSHQEFLRLCDQEEYVSESVDPTGGLILLSSQRCNAHCLSYLATELFHFVEMADLSDENSTYQIAPHIKESKYNSGLVTRYRLARLTRLAPDLAEGCLVGRNKITARDFTNQYMKDFSLSPCLTSERRDQGTARYSLEFSLRPREAPFGNIVQSRRRIIDRSDQSVVTSFSVYTLNVGAVEAAVEALVESSPVALCKAKIASAPFKLIERLRVARDRGIAEDRGTGIGGQGSGDGILNSLAMN